MLSGRFLFRQGLLDLAPLLRGDEVVHAGMRPYGFHAGNKLPILVYPYLLAQELSRRGILPRFRYILTFNDWESDTLDTPQGYPITFIPKGDTFQYQPDPYGCCATLVDHWEGRVRREVMELTKEFPYLRVSYVRTSNLRWSPDFMNVLRAAFSRKEEIAGLLAECVEAPLHPDLGQLGGAVCQLCHSIQGQTSYDQERDAISFSCQTCGHSLSGPFQDQDYWMYVHVIGAAKYMALRPRVWFFGGDFLLYKTVDFVDRLVGLLSGRPPDMAHLITPILTDSQGRKMSKSLGNTIDLPLGALLGLVRDVDEMYVSAPE